MARTKQVAKDEVEITVESPGADVHHMVRRLGRETRPDGTIDGNIADDHVRTWLQAGYKLRFVQSLGLEPNGVNILYIFVKDE